MIRWILDNKSWVFSGIGVAIGSAIFSFFIFGIDSNANNTSQSGIVNIKADRDVTITNLTRNNIQKPTNPAIDLTKSESDDLLRIGRARHAWIGRSPNNKRIILPFEERAILVQSLVEKGFVEFSYPSSEFLSIFSSLNLKKISLPRVGDPNRRPGQIFEYNEPIPDEIRGKLEQYKYFLSPKGIKKYESMLNYVKPMGG